MPALPRLRRLPQGLLAGAIVLSGMAVASADDLYRDRTTAGGLPQGTAGSGKLQPGSPAANHCAAFGAGFVAVQGTDTCVKLGGHVRVQFSTGLQGWNKAPQFALPTAVDAPSRER